MKCCVPLCRETGIFRFPRDPKRRRVWERAISVNFNSTKSSRLCLIHFKEDDIIRNRESFWTGLTSSRRTLTSTAVPSLKLSLEKESDAQIKALQRRLFGNDYCGKEHSCSSVNPEPIRDSLNNHDDEDEADMFSESLSTNNNEFVQKCEGDSTKFNMRKDENRK